MRSKSRQLAAGTILAALAILALWHGLGPAASGGRHGWFSLLPAFATLLICFWTRNVLAALLAGTVYAALVLGRYNVVQSLLKPSLGTEQYAIILLVYVWCMGGMAGIWQRSGSARFFADWVGRKMVHSARTSRLFTWIMGCVFHQGGTISAVLTGMTVKPLTDRHRVSHEELSYIVDSTGSPVATVLPFNAWPIYVAGLVAGTIPLLPDTQTAVNFFFETIPYNFYGWLAVLGTLLLAIGIMPWVNPSLKRAIHRAEKTGQLDAPKARPIGTLAPSSDADRPWARPGPLEFVLPLLMLLGVAITPAVLALLRGEKPNVPIAEAFALAWLTAFLVSILRGRSLSDVFDASVDGIKSVTLGGIILGLALVLGTNMKELQAADFILATFKDAVPTAVLPVFLFFLCMVVAFGTGTSFGTFAVVFPIALPLAWQMVPDPSYISVSFGAILGGAVFGDQCSPISDTTVLSSLSSGCDLMDHVTTQLPQALLIAAVAGLLTFAATLSIL